MCPHSTPNERGITFTKILIITVVAVPEGLPLAVTLALAFATKRITAENSLVRAPGPCEAMVNASVLCTAKAGTLTQDSMSVVPDSMGIHDKDLWNLEEHQDCANTPDQDQDQPQGQGITETTDEPQVNCKYADEFSIDNSEINVILSPQLSHPFTKSITINSTPFEDVDPEIREASLIGSKTEAAQHLNRNVERVSGVGEVGNTWLPQEIVDYIVNHISDDRPTLFACTYLSRTWCIAARVHLHRTFTISDHEGFDVIDDLQQVGVIDLVRKVVAVRKFNQANFLMPSKMERLHAFARLQELEIGSLDVEAPLLWLYEHCDVLKSTVLSLTLRYPKAGIKQLACFISLFSNLENLTVDGIGTGAATVDDSQVPVVSNSPPFTGRLTLMGIRDEEFLSALASMQNGVRFRIVDLQFCLGMQELVDACAGTMERLVCHPSESHGTYRYLYSVMGESDIRCQTLRP